MPGPLFRHACVGAMLLAMLLASAAHAEDAAPGAPSHQVEAKQPGPKGSGDSAHDGSVATATDHRRLPPDSTTRHKLVLPDRTLAFTATAGAIRIFDDKGEPQADIATTAYQLDGADPRSRPVTFVFNGGPGASSAWLQFGSNGPWRIAMDRAIAGSPTPPALEPNAETWLDFTDLVFIDPLGTGYSRMVASGDEARKRFFTVDGDVASIALVIRRWLEKADRMQSPKFITGESYGGIRGPKIVRNLQTRQGVAVNGLILISPALDFGDVLGTGLTRFVASLPSMAAVAREKEKGGPLTRADMADVEAYARGEFLSDLVKGQADAEATRRLADRFAALTGIDQAKSRRLAGRFDISEFRRAFDRRDGKVTGRYDASVLGFDPYPDTSASDFNDPSEEPLLTALTSAAFELYAHKLNWRPQGSYELLSRTVNREWDFGKHRNSVQSVSDIRELLAADPKFKLLVAHGLFDLATPYFASKIRLDQLPTFGSRDRVKLVVYSGGHMFYSRDDSRQALRDEVRALMR
ncbi:peptidase S10, serine carboxypeptidase [Nitrobacter hamburgensis X14]|uniref:Peptidase S10, serine carboxypeptidase n=1 Tax=Nitrobacter hamburgensis (strain DSM 10229 / NCIMB 13809 / X14) TaxID=323097 RepID=Q1QP78_NITHX|nr:peptidase S10 [Nitrobacter hamburgensis]ABE61969.1 peptidase S10, serine carboxypeptidase [Nitrobacter hamburgensis X14]